MAVFNIQYIRAVAGEFDASEAHGNRPFNLRQYANS